MSFLFKSKQKGAAQSSLPTASRDLRSSDGPGVAPGVSQIPTLNGAGVKPASPTPGSVSNSLNSSINSLPPSDQPVPRVGMRVVPEERPGAYIAANQNRTVSPSPEQKMLRERNQESPRQRLLGQAPRAPPAMDSSPYPWASRQLTFTAPQSNPFPRYGAAVNAAGSKEGSIYLMGGLINGSTVKGDLWMVDAGPGNPTCHPVATTSEGPGPRVGHSSLLVGNAFIVFGGDTKMDEGDMLDDTLYLLNTSTKQWSRALPAGPRPPGRYGHTLNILGSRIYIFGGQVEGYFFNDLYAFDLNALQQASNKWELLIQNTIDGGPPHGQIPPARTNHTVVTWGDKLYLFGGTDGVHWFNDVWSYSPLTNSWTQLDCIGYIPSPREGHAAALVGDVMYIFGGRTEDGNDLGDLAAFRISSRRWYTFQNMGPSPSPRSGHSMTTVGKQIVVLAGEPSSAPRDPVELAFAYFLDTTKIRYPPDTVNNSPQAAPFQRPSGERSNTPLGAGRIPPGMVERPERFGSGDSTRLRNESRLPQATRSPQQPPVAISSSSPTSTQQPRPNGLPVASRQPTRAMSPDVDAGGSPSMGSRLQTDPVTPVLAQTSYYDGEDASNQQQQVETYQPSQDASSTLRGLHGVQRQLPVEMGDSIRQPSPPPNQLLKSTELHDRPQDSGIGSSPALSHQYEELLRELEQAKQRNAWYASELALARKSGYLTRAMADSPVLDERAPDIFGEDDKPLVEALLRMRDELNRVQATIDEQSQSAAARIAETEAQRDAAIREAAHAKTRLAGQPVGTHSGQPIISTDGQRRATPDQERSNDMSRRLASSLATQTELSRRVDGLIQEIEAEKKARSLAEDTADAAQKRVTELDMHRQQYSSDLESLRGDLYDAQRQARDVTASHTELSSQHEILILDKSAVDNRLQDALTDADTHTSILARLREAVAASAGKAALLEQKIEEERASRDALEAETRHLRSEHAERTAELDSTSKRLRDAKEMAERHAEEARTHREAVLAGLDKVNSRDADVRPAEDERIAALRRQAESANTLVRQNQAAADAASEKLRRAEERIAGLEAFQESASRDGLSMRKQLQAALRDNQGLFSRKAELEAQVQSTMLEMNALAVQHSSLKDVLAERGVNASEVRRSRALDSPGGASNFSRFSTPDLQRVRELEQQLEASLKSHDDIKIQLDEVADRDDRMKREYEDKLTALDNDHQAAVKYLRGTEKMLSKMKQELQRVKNENADLRRKLDSDAAAGPDAPSAEWEAERVHLRQETADAQARLATTVAEFEARIGVAQQQLQVTKGDLATSRTAHAASQADLSALRTAHDESRADLARLQNDNGALDARARDAEAKVQLLLDQVESSVDNYRRQSRLHEIGSAATGGPGGATTMNGTFHTRSLSAISASSALGAGTGSHHGRDASTASDIGLPSPTSSATAGPADDGRNSLALDSLATELDALRSHWETTNKTYRLGDKSDFHPPHATSGIVPIVGVDRSSIALGSWRPGLGVGHDDDDQEGDRHDEDGDHDDDDDDDERGYHVSTAEAQNFDPPIAEAAIAAPVE